MNFRRLILHPIFFVAMLSLPFGECKGCKDSSSPSAHVSPAPTMKADSGMTQGTYNDGPLTRQETYLIDETLFSLAGQTDSGNRYSSTVMVSTSIEAGAESIHCSGVLVAPGLVLTAGHCVCARQKATLAGNKAGHIIDSSKCARSALVTTVLYGISKETGLASSRSGEYKGEVRPHPEIKLTLDDQERLLSSNADLAIISLQQSVKGIPPATRLPLKELQGTESIVMVSYGYDRLNPNLHGKRRFKDYKILKTLEPGGSFLFEQPQRDLYTGDSGGPCLRPTDGGDELVGISTRGLGHEPTFTSIYFHRHWLQAELNRAPPKDADSVQ